MFINRSFSAKLTFWVLLAAALVFASSSVLGLHFTRQLMEREADHRADLELDNVQLYADHLLSNSQVAAYNFKLQLHYPDLPTADSIQAAMEHFLAINTQLSGVTVALEPGVLDSHPDGFAPYVARTDSGLMHFDLSERHDFREGNWYRKVVKNRNEFWTYPFRDRRGCVSTAYCIPLENEHQELQGAMEVMLALDTLTQRVLAVKPYPHARITLVDQYGYFLVHPDHERILDLASGEERCFVDGRQPTTRGCIKSHDANGETLLRYHAPVTRTRWTIVLECPESDILAEVYQMRLILIAILVLGLLGLLTVCVVTIRRMTRPVKAFAQAAADIARGNFHTAMPTITDHNELWHLGRSLDDMQHDLERYIDDLRATTASKAIIEGELQTASRIQMSMVPKTFPAFPERQELDMYALLEPAKEVGGDLYDFFVKGDSLFFCVGDVSGKGVPASLFMAVTRTLFRITSHQHDDPADIVIEMNDHLAEGNEENMFVTLFIGRLDLLTGLLSYCSAGHNAPLMIPRNETPYYLPVRKAMPAGAMEGMLFVSQSLNLRHGDSILLYTDGVTEAEDPERRLFGETRLLNEMSRCDATAAKDRVGHVLAAIRNHAQQQPQSDDITLLNIIWN